MSDAFEKALGALGRRLVSWAGQDAELRAELRMLAEAWLAATGETEPVVEAAARLTTDEVVVAPREPHVEQPGPAGKDGVFDAPRPAEVVPVEPAAPTSPRVELTLGQSRPSLDESPPAPRTPTGPWVGDDDLPSIEARCRLKAEGTRWAGARRRLIAEGADYRTEVTPTDRDIIERAKALPDCYLWMNSVDAQLPEDATLLEHVAGCFETVADAVSLIRGVLDDPDDHREVFEQSLDLLAEAQSGLRAGIGRIYGPNDADQIRVYNWLKMTTAHHQIYIRRHMRADDPADPARWANLVARIEELGNRFQQSRRQAKQQKSRLGRLGYHRKLIGAGKGTPHDWLTIAKTVDEMIGDGLPPSNREIRELLLPIIDDLPELDDTPRGFAMFLREVDRYLATPVPSSNEELGRAPTAEQQEAARLLSGRSVVLIGGTRRPESQDALRTALGLQEVIWIETREHQSIGPFESFIARQDVALVLLAIRWSSHSFGDVKQFCDRYNKPLVRLPAGYHPNQVAAQILAQCSEQLRGE